MAMGPDAIRGAIYTDAASRVGQIDRLLTPNVTQNAYQAPQAQISATSDYRLHQIEVLNFLQQLGFNQDQIAKLAQLSNLPFQQYGRVVLLAQGLDKQGEIFEQFVKTLKTMATRGQNIDSGGKALLDGLDRLLGIDTRKAVDSLFSKYASSHRDQTDSEDIANDKKPERLSGDVLDQIKKMKVQIERSVTLSGAKPVQEFVDFAAGSIEEFPTRFPVDLYSFTQLSNKGVTLKEYVMFASEVSPTRLVNLLAEASKQGGAGPILDTLREALRNGDNLEDVVAVLEARLGFALAPKKADAPSSMSSKPDAEAVVKELSVPLTNREIVVTKGEHTRLSFVALDALEGAVKDDKSSFVLFPQRLIYPGREFNPSDLPVGIYFLLAKGMNARNEPISQWTKVIVKEAKRKNPEDEKKEKNENENSDSQKQPRREPPKEDADPVTTSFTNKSSGPFLGEIALPLDYLSKDPRDLVTLTPAGGILLDENEFEAGRFVSHGVRFRFLTNEMAEWPSKTRRHGLIKLNPSAAFARYDAGLKRFTVNPAARLDEWKACLTDFFNSLTEIFPAGEKTFGIARELFERESEAFVRGESGTYYKVESNERRGDIFLNAFYSKGSFALAYAGDVCGALYGLSASTLCGVSDEDQAAVLGEYLAELRRLHFTHQSDESLRNMYGVHISHAFADHLKGNPFYKDEGESFVKATVLPILPPAAPAGTPKTLVPSPYGAYRVA